MVFLIGLGIPYFSNPFLLFLFYTSNPRSFLILSNFPSFFFIVIHTIMYVLYDQLSMGHIDSQIISRTERGKKVLNKKGIKFMYGFRKNTSILYHMCVFLYRPGVVKKNSYTPLFPL